MTATRSRNLARNHFAFMRALAQGMDMRSSWERYLLIEGEATDIRTVRRTINWIRDEFAAAARREGRPGTARLIVLDVQDSPANPLPTLAEYAAQRGMEEFSEAEQQEAYVEAFGLSAGGNRRRQRLIEKQLAALTWLEQLVAQDPRPGDPVDAWLAPALADRIQAAGIPILFLLAERINGMGAGWHTGISGLGAGKAGRVVAWMWTHQDSIGVPIGAHVGQRRRELTTRDLAAVVAPATALRPFEKFLVPAELDGSAGTYRAPRERCMLAADNDYAAIATWLASKRAGKGGDLSHTQRAYRKEAERLLLWAVLQRGKPLSSLNVEDANAYLAFLADPPSSWCGPSHHQRWSPFWRPLEGALSPAAQTQTLTILRSFYRFLIAQQYLTGNPFEAVTPPRVTVRPIGSGRTLTFAQYDHIAAQLRTLADTAVNRRMQLAISWLYATGMRLAEMVDARCGSLNSIEFQDEAGGQVVGWMLEVVGKGGRMREVPVPDNLVADLGDELSRHGRAADPEHADNAQVPILARYEVDGDSPLPLTAHGLYKQIKRLFIACADELAVKDPAAAARLRRASTHWLRHTHASHSLNGRPGHAPVPLQVAQQNLGHVSLGTTSGYITTERDARIRALQQFWKRLR